MSVINEINKLNELGIEPGQPWTDDVAQINIIQNYNNRILSTVEKLTIVQTILLALILWQVW